MTITISGTSGVTFPAGGLGNTAGAVVGTTDTQTLTNKTIDASQLVSASVTSTQLATAVQPIGVGQTWQNLTSSRANATTYTNSTGRPIIVSITGSNATNAGMSLTVSGVVVAWSGWYSLAGGQVSGTIAAVVPSGATYSTSGWLSGSINPSWNELR
jgi:hypothetical protein